MCRCEAGWNEVERPGGGNGRRSEAGEVERKGRDGTEGEGWDTAEHDGAERSGGEAERKR